jgi:hypothetical protein
MAGQDKTKKANLKGPCTWGEPIKASDMSGGKTPCILKCLANVWGDKQNVIYIRRL